MPTGSAFFRQLYLALRITDAAGRVLHDTSDPAPASPPEWLRTRLLDARGELTLFPWRAARVENLTLAPLEQRVIQITFALPAAPQGPLTFLVSLNFRKRSTDPTFRVVAFHA
jgi:hypothetical protein